MLNNSDSYRFLVNKKLSQLVRLIAHLEDQIQETNYCRYCITKEFEFKIESIATKLSNDISFECDSIYKEIENSYKKYDYHNNENKKRIIDDYKEYSFDQSSKMTEFEITIASNIQELFAELKQIVPNLEYKENTIIEQIKEGIQKFKEQITDLNIQHKFKINQTEENFQEKMSCISKSTEQKFIESEKRFKSDIETLQKDFRVKTSPSLHFLQYHSDVIPLRSCNQNFRNLVIQILENTKRFFKNCKIDINDIREMHQRYKAEEEYIKSPELLAVELELQNITSNFNSKKAMYKQEISILENDKNKLSEINQYMKIIIKQQEEESVINSEITKVKNEIVKQIFRNEEDQFIINRNQEIIEFEGKKSEILKRNDPNSKKIEQYNALINNLRNELKELNDLYDTEKVFSSYNRSASSEFLALEEEFEKSNKNHIDSLSKSYQNSLGVLAIRHENNRSKEIMAIKKEYIPDTSEFDDKYIQKLKELECELENIQLPKEYENFEIEMRNKRRDMLWEARDRIKAMRGDHEKLMKAYQKNEVSRHEKSIQFIKLSFEDKVIDPKHLREEFDPIFESLEATKADLEEQLQHLRNVDITDPSIATKELDYEESRVRKLYTQQQQESEMLIKAAQRKAKKEVKRLKKEIAKVGERTLMIKSAANRNTQEGDTAVKDAINCLEAAISKVRLKVDSEIRAENKKYNETKISLEEKYKSDKAMLEKEIINFVPFNPGKMKNFDERISKVLQKVTEKLTRKKEKLEKAKAISTAEMEEAERMNKDARQRALNLQPREEESERISELEKLLKAKEDLLIQMRGDIVRYKENLIRDDDAFNVRFNQNRTVGVWRPVSRSVNRNPMRPMTTQGTRTSARTNRSQIKHVNSLKNLE